MKELNWLTERPIAHRGFHDMNVDRWENTLPAFTAAIERGYGIECDVHLSADGVPMVFHDRDMERLTGEQGLVIDQLAADLVQKRIGGTQDHIPTLAEALALIAGKVPLVVELKGTQGRDDELVAKVAAALADYPGPVAIMSFDHWLVRRFAKDAPGIPAGLTAFGSKPAELEAHFSMLAYPIDFVSFAVSNLPNPFVDFVRTRLSMPVITWTVREPWAVALSATHADQITFEGFEP